MDLVCFSSVLAAAWLAAAEERTWLPNTNYDNPTNWDVARVPCSSDRVVFPADLELGVLLPDGSIAVRELVLARSGELMLPLDCRLTVTGMAAPSRDCRQPSDVLFSRKMLADWLLPDNWRGPGDNAATPHAFRVPCQHESVVFPPDSSFGVRLPQEPVSLRQLTLQGQEVSPADWPRFLQTEAGERQFVGAEDVRGGVVQVTGDAPCSDPAGCSCVTPRVQDEVCRLQEPLCGPQPPCMSAVRPLGHCCSVCGAVLLLDYNTHFRLSDLKLAVEDFLKDKEFSGLVSHVGKTAETGEIQVVMVDRGEYSSAPSGAALQLAAVLENRKEALGVTAVVAKFSGPAVYPGGPAKIIGDVFGPLFGVLAMLGLFYLVFVVYGDRPLLHWWTGVGSGGTFMFARFVNTVDGAGDLETAMEAEADVKPEAEASSHGLPSGFHNPMFGKSSASVADGETSQGQGQGHGQGRGAATQENPVFLELQGRHSSTSEDTAEEDLLSSQDEDEEQGASPSPAR